MGDNAVTKRVSRLSGRRQKQIKLVLFLLPFMAMVTIFSYIPLFGWSYAFVDYSPGLQLWECEFVGLKYFERIFTNSADFIKVMVSGLMDFAHAGTLSEEGLTEEEIRYMIGTAHDAGMADMAHCNGDETCRYAVQAEVDSLEHGVFMEEETLVMLAESRTVWIPTLSPIGNLLGCGRFPDEEVTKNLESQLRRIRRAAELGACIGLGSDAGAYLVPHGKGTMDEHAYLRRAGVSDGLLCEAEERIRLRFKR